ncbi:MAG TPA: vitamin K epoxide reductase family protein [Pirellulaceae bacterium]|nr:vitamin K epoxide reductase family protein [Pirellulaceae bacterium]
MNDNLSAPTSSYVIWPLRAIALIAVVLSGYLTWLALTGETAAGCGQGGTLDCAHVLRTRWSKWLDLPVALPALSLWLTTLLLTLFGGRLAPLNLQRVAWFVIGVLMSAAVTTGGWFVWLQAGELQHFCVYCLTLHACALVGWLLAIVALRHNLASLASSVLLGLLLGATVPAGQLLLPPPALYRLHTVEEQAFDDPLLLTAPILNEQTLRLMPADAKTVTPAEERYITVLGGEAKVDVNARPHLGASDAKYVVVKLFDYACYHCRKLHHELQAVQQEYDGQLTIVLVPVPLSDKCNPLIDAKDATSPDACALAKLALIVWRLAPQKFAQFDEWLFEPETPRTYEAARKEVVAWLGEELLRAAEQDPAFDWQLEQNVELFGISPAELLPQIMSGQKVLSQQVDSEAELRRLLAQEFGLVK